MRGVYYNFVKVHLGIADSAQVGLVAFAALAQRLFRTVPVQLANSAGAQVCFTESSSYFRL